MRKFFTPNITTVGRVLRVLWGLGLIVAGLLLHSTGKWLCVLLVLAGGFSLFEAVRGWCVLRACGVRTRY